MEIKKVIIHEVIKETKKKDIKVEYSDGLLDADSQSNELIESLLKSFNGDKLMYAIFDKSDGKYFPEKFSEYCKGKRLYDDFIKFSKGAVNNLTGFMNNSILSAGGYLIFLEYSESGKPFFAIFLVRDAIGKILSKKGDKYSINNVEYVDTQNLAMAIRINESRITEEEGNYLTFTHKKNNEISEYFLNWISIQKRETNSEFTQKLYELIKNVDRPKEPLTAEEIDLEDYRERVFGFLSNKTDKLVNLYELGSYFYNDENYLINRAKELDLEIDYEFKYDKNILKKFTKVEVKRDGITLKFSSGSFDKKIRFSDENQNLIIIESELLAKALRKEYEDYK